MTYTTDTSSSHNIGIENGQQYYIKCKGSVVEGSTVSQGLYLTAPSSTSGYVKQSTFTGTNNQKWIVSLAGGGYYYLYPVSNPNCTLYANGDATYETMIGNLTDVGYNDYKRWKFIRNWDGSYHIVSKAGDGVLGLWTEQTANNSTVYHNTLRVSMDHLDDWTLEKVSKGTAYAYTFTADSVGSMGWDTRSLFNQNSATPLSLTGYTVSHQTNKLASVGRGTLSTADLWLFSGHGLNSVLQFSTETQASYLVAHSDTISSTLYGVDDYYVKGELSNLRLVMLGACLAGNDSVTDGVSSNLVGVLYQKGAHLVQGYVHESDADADKWWGHFFVACARGDTIAEAFAYADAVMISSNAAPSMRFHVFNRHVLGDTAMCLCPQVQN